MQTRTVTDEKKTPLLTYRSLMLLGEGVSLSRLIVQDGGINEHILFNEKRKKRDGLVKCGFVNLF